MKTKKLKIRIPIPRPGVPFKHKKRYSRKSKHKREKCSKYND